MEKDIFFVFNSITKKMKKLADNELSKYGLTNTEMRLLNYLYFFKPEGACQDEFLKRIEIDQSNIGRSLKKLENMGYIKRQKSSKDKRSNKVMLTVKGTEIKTDLLEIRSNIKKTFSLNTKILDYLRFEKILNIVDANLTFENYEKIKNNN